MDDVCILVTTFLRDNLLYRCIKSIRKYYPDITIFIGDNGKETREKNEFCTKYNCKIFKLSFDLGVGGTRNESLKHVPEKYKYIAIIEDDIVFTKGTKIENWLKILKEEKEVGLVGCLLKRDDQTEQHYEANTWVEGDTHYIRSAEIPQWKEIDGIRYTILDMILNVFLMKRETWEQVQWDPQFKTALEHADFFMRLKYECDDKDQPILNKDKSLKLRECPIRVAYCPDVWMYHRHDDQNSYYRKYRTRPVGWQLFGKKWGVTYSVSDFNRFNPICYETMGIPISAKETNLSTTIAILEKHRCKWWLDAGTCLGAVRNGDFIKHDDDINIGLPGEHLELWDEFIKVFKAEGFELWREWEHDGKRLELSFKREGIKVDLFFYFRKGDWMWHGAFGPNKLGLWDRDIEFLPHVFSAILFDDLEEIFFKGNRCFVPNPSKQYLFERYGPYWTAENKEYRFWKDCLAIDRNVFKKNKTAFIGGVWDFFHVGHLNILEKAKMLDARLIVGVLTDEATERYKNLPIIPFEERKRIIEALKITNRVITQNDTDPTEDFKKLRLKPDYIIHGDDWDHCPGEHYVKQYGGKVVFFPYTQEISTTKIRQRILESKPAKKKTDEKTRIAIGIKTFMREEALFKTLKAIKEHFPLPYRIYLADDSRISDDKEYIYGRLDKEDHKIFRLSFNSGLSVGRNRIVKEITEDYILIMDDDILLQDGDSIKNMKTVLDSDERLGLVSGMLFTESGQYLACENYQKGLKFEWKSGFLHRYPIKRDIHEVDGIKFIYADQVVNFFLAKKEIFQKVSWDNRIKIEWEHIDFFLALKQSGWKSAVCLDTKAAHQYIKPDAEYNRFRRNITNQYFFQKHQIFGVLNFF